MAKTRKERRIVPFEYFKYFTRHYLNGIKLN